MTVSVQQTQQVLEAMDWYFGGRECRSIQFVDDVAGSLAGEYWDVNVIEADYSERKYVFWLQDDMTSGTAPVVDADQTLVQVDYVQGDNAGAVATAFAGAITGAVALDAVLSIVSQSTGVVVYENRFLGAVTAEDNSGAPSFTFEILAAGFGGNIGAVAQGGATVSTEQSLEDIVSDQTGDIILDQIIKGAAVSAEMTIAEMTTANWENLVGKGSGDIEALSSDLIGYGTSKLYQSSFANAGQLVGHPIRLPLTDRSADICIFKTMPQMNSINYSGSEVQGGEFAFTALRDQSKPESISLFARGDHSLV